MRGYCESFEAWPTSALALDLALAFLPIQLPAPDTFTQTRREKINRIYASSAHGEKETFLGRTQTQDPDQIRLVPYLTWVGTKLVCTDQGTGNKGRNGEYQGVGGYTLYTVFVCTYIAYDILQEFEEEIWLVLMEMPVRGMLLGVWTLKGTLVSRRKVSQPTYPSHVQYRWEIFPETSCKLNI